MLTPSSSIPADQWVEMSESREVPRISILMPIFNQRAFVREAIQSVIDQKAVTAEIIISDDDSSDGTFEVARQQVLNALGSGTVRHRILMRRGSQRLWRDHIHLLADRASCDLVCQAHGDDVSYPMRAFAIVSCAEQHSGYAMFVSLHSELLSGAPAGDALSPRHASIPLVRIAIERLIKPSRVVVGSGLAWRRSCLARFDRIDSRTLPTSHDRVMAFRAALSGGVMLIDTPLYGRRRHQGSASSSLFHQSDGKLRRRLVALVRDKAMLLDLDRAKEVGVVSEEVHRSLVAELNNSRIRELDGFLELYYHQMAHGVDLGWTKRA